MNEIDEDTIQDTSGSSELRCMIDTYDRPASAKQKAVMLNKTFMPQVLKTNQERGFPRPDTEQKQELDELVLSTVYLRQKPKAQTPQLLLEPVQLESEQ